MINVGNRIAFLDVIAWSEGTSTIPGSDNGYDVLVGSTPQHPLLFKSYDDHPRVLNLKLRSTAAGRYQCLEHNYDFYKIKLGLKDFGHLAQDAIALQQIRECHALDAVDDGEIINAIGKVAHIWASFPGAGYGQHEQKFADLKNVFAKNRALIALS